jgi:hypothetical protein
MHEREGVLFLVNKEIRRYCMTFETSFMKVSWFVEKDIHRLEMSLGSIFPVFDNSVVLFRIQKVRGYSLDPETTPFFCDIP